MDGRTATAQGDQCAAVQCEKLMTPWQTCIRALPPSAATSKPPCQVGVCDFVSQMRGLRHKEYDDRAQAHIDPSDSTDAQ